MEVFQCDTSGNARQLRSSLENPRISLNDVEAWDEMFGEGVASSGVRISRDTALRLSGFFRGVHLISARIAELPLFVEREVASDSYAIDRKHSANKFIRLDAMPGEMSALTFKHTLQGHALTHGNGFGYAPQNGLGEVQELLPLMPDRTRCVRINGRLKYVTSIGGTLDDQQSELRYLDPDEVLHVKGLGWDGYTGYSVLRMGREVLGGAVATQAYGNAFFSQGTAVGLVIETDNALSDTAYARMRNMWHKTRAGLKAAHKAAILEEGAKARTLSLSAADAQLLESKAMDLTFIEHLLGLPPGKLSGRGSGRNVEADNQEFVDDCLGWWLSSWESELSRKLLTVAEYENETHRIRFDRKALARANLAAQAMWWRTALGGRPWATQQEARRATGLDPTKGEDNIAEPLNMGSLQASADGGTFKSQASARNRSHKLPACADKTTDKTREKKLVHDDLPFGDDDSDEGDDQEVSLQTLTLTHRAIVSDAVARMARRVATFVQRSAANPDLLAKFEADHVPVIREALAVVSPLTRAGRLDEWFISLVAAPLRALVDGEPATSPDSLAKFFDALPARAAELV